MVTVIISALIGAFIGWSVPQPAWAARVQTKIKQALQRWIAR